MWPGQSIARLNRSANAIIYHSYLCLFIYGSFTVLCYLTALCLTIAWCDSSFLHLSYAIQ